MTPTEASPHGLILLDKPSGMTSHDCVQALRRLCPRKFKVGHGGTLDPFCTGLLILLLGKGTRLARFFQGMDKAYEGVIRFGEGTDTYDRDGTVVATGDPPGLSPAEWQEAANRFVGPSQQIPPAYSAKRIGHIRAYEMARKGEAPHLAPVPIQIYKFEVSPVDARDLYFRLRCSSGTYVRALARDLGAAVGCPAHCFQLCRTEVGPFTVHRANPLADPFAPGGYLPFDTLDMGFPIFQATDREERLFLNGQNVAAPKGLQGHEGMVKVLAPNGRFLALARADARFLHPAVVFPEKE